MNVEIGVNATLLSRSERRLYTAIRLSRIHSEEEFSVIMDYTFHLLLSIHHLRNLSMIHFKAHTCQELLSSRIPFFYNLFHSNMTECATGEINLSSDFCGMYLLQWWEHFWNVSFRISFEYIRLPFWVRLYWLYCNFNRECSRFDDGILLLTTS